VGKERSKRRDPEQNGKEPGYRGFDLLLNDGRIEVHLSHEFPNNAIKVKTREKFAAKQWQHVLATYDGSGKAAGLRIFVDGGAREAEIEKDKLSGTITNDEPLRIGSRNGEATAGLIDDVRIYDRFSVPKTRAFSFSKA
jgi:hypothetical protein